MKHVLCAVLYSLHRFPGGAARSAFWMGELGALQQQADQKLMGIRFGQFPWMPNSRPTCKSPPGTAVQQMCACILCRYSQQSRLKAWLRTPSGLERVSENNAWLWGAGSKAGQNCFSGIAELQQDHVAISTPTPWLRSFSCTVDMRGVAVHKIAIMCYTVWQHRVIYNSIQVYAFTCNCVMSCMATQKCVPVGIWHTWSAPPYVVRLWLQPTTHRQGSGLLAPAASIHYLQ